MVKRCALLGMASYEGYVCDDELVVPELEARGWCVDTVDWAATADWGRYDLAILRSTWDYAAQSDRFLAVLEAIDASTAQLLNPLSVVQWNLRKTYLMQLSEAGVPIVPTLLLAAGNSYSPADWFDRWESREVVLKPVVGASAEGALRISRDAAGEERFAPDRDYLAQPFVESVLSEGEYSLFYFLGEISHAIVKRPASGDFRVQEEHGGRLETIEPESDLLAAGRRCLKAVGETLLYARIDFVRSAEGVPWLMELELIEPSLYLRLEAGAPERFAIAIDNWSRSEKRPTVR